MATLDLRNAATAACSALFGLVLIAPAAQASDVEVRVRSNGSDVVVAAPGSTVAFDVEIELSDAASAGLAGFAFDLEFTGGALAPLTAPTTGAMANFVGPVGLANPAGYGGTQVAGRLAQVGGAQNTIGNFFAPQPTGAVIQNIANGGAPEQVGLGTLTAPLAPGVYLVRPSDVLANVLETGQTGFPFWRVEPAEAALTSDLTVIVPGSLTADVGTLSVTTGGQQNLSLDAGAAQAGRVYLMLGSATGDAPAIPFGSINVPIVYDGYTQFTLTSPNSPLLANSLSLLDGLGKGQASFILQPGSSPNLVGATIFHTYLLVTPAIDFASNSVQLYLVP